jgi:hypothetical protein
MAPLPESSIKSYLSSLFKRTPSPQPSTLLSDLSPKAAALAARAQNILPRDVNPGAGVTPPANIPNKFVFVVFGLIGLGFVVTGIWFFFWAKNGGFYFKENDWDDYKSTVLRRKGPNGTTLSGATATTDLGGGSIVHGEKRNKWGRKKKGMKRYKDFEDDESSQMTGSNGGSELASEISELKYQAKQVKKEKKAKRESTLRQSVEMDEEADVGVRDTIRAYRHEKPARVGGLNKQPDGSAWDGSANDNSTAASEHPLLSNRETTPTNTPTKVRKERKDNYTGGTGGIRKVVSTSESTSLWHRSGGSNKKTEEEDRIKAEAKKLQEKGRAAQRRDFSFQTGDDSTVVSEERSARREERERRRASRSPTKKIPGSYHAESEVGSNVSSDIGTKSYHHPIPGLSSTAGSEYAEEKRKKRNGGYRRGRSDSLGDDGN